ncbi:Ig-like domain-containing protein [Eisenbergiella sp.]
MPNQPTDKNQKAVPENIGRRMSNPSDEKPQKMAGTEEEQLSGKIEKVTESLLSQWEISEDDFEDTQDLTETAAHISRQMAPGASNRDAAGSIRREAAGPRGQSASRSQSAPRGEAAPRSNAGEKRNGMEGGRRTEDSYRPESRRPSPDAVTPGSRRNAEGRPAAERDRIVRSNARQPEKETSGERRSEGSRPATERTGERKASSARLEANPRRPEANPKRPEANTRRPEAGKTADQRNASAERIRPKMQTDASESRRQEPAEKRQPVRSDSGKDTAAVRAPRSERYESRQGSQTPRMADSERPNRTSSAAKAAGKRRPHENDDWEEEAYERPANAKKRAQAPSGKSRDYAENTASRNPGRKSPSHKKQENPVVEFWNSLHTMDKVVGFMGIFVCIFAVITFSVLANAKSVDEQVEAFASVGQNLSQLNIAGESTFLAVADAHKAKQEAADFSESMEESEEYNEKDDNSDVQVGLNMTSVEKDLKIKFVNRKTGKLIPHVDFQVEIKGPDKTYNKDDDNTDGIIYLTGITPGKYTVRITGPENQDGYSIPSDAQEVTVKDHIEYKKIDVSDEVKKESEVNAAKEDTQVKTQTESVIQDTVEWVESTKTPIGSTDGKGEYVEVKKADIPDPSATASITFAKLSGMKSQKPWIMRENDTVQPITESGDTKTSDTNQPSVSDEEPDSKPSESTDNPPDPSKPDPDPDPEPSNPDPEPSTPDPGPVEVSGVSLSPSSLSGKVGESATLNAQVSPDNAADKSVRWSSSNDNVAKVSNGTVTFVGAGNATITVTTNSGGKTATADVTVSAKENPVQNVTVTGDSAVTVGGSITLTAKVSPDGASYDSIRWSSSDTSIATVDGGKVTGVKAGTVTITAEAGGKSGNISVTVKEAEAALKSIKITGADSGKKGSTVQLSITPDPANADASVTWKSSDEKIAKVDANGKVTCVNTGKVTITATSKKDTGKTATFSFQVTADEKNEFDVKEVKITAGETKNDYFTIKGDVESRSFSIANTKYATVDGNGKIKAIRAGETEITVTAKFRNGDTRSKKVKLTVVAAKVEKIVLDKDKVTMKVGDTVKLNPTITTSGYTGCLWYTSDKSIVSLEEHGNGTIKALRPGKVTITAKSSEDTSKTATCEVTVTGDDPRNDTKTPLKDKSGNLLYVKTADGKFVAAVVADYYKYDTFYRVNENTEYKYTGWQTIDGRRYYFDKNGNKVTGEQVIQGVKYSFGSDGALNAGSGVLGIDVSKHNGNINWTEVRNSGVSYVIIRCGYRGSSTGALIEDPKFRANIQGATAAGLKVGIYFFTQAVNQIEAVEEASMTVSLIKNYKISYPVFLDVEASGGRADGLDTATRTQIVNAYCQTIANSGYTAGVYANKTWLNSKLNVGALGGYKIWLAQYAAAPTYNGRYDMWQYSSKGKIGGISGYTDLNISYLGY